MKQTVDLDRASYDYDYPAGLDLRPKKRFHEDLVKRLKRMLDRSQEVMSSRYNSWREIDRSLQVYVRPDSERKKEEGEGKGRQVIMPTSYANLETLLTYMSAAFFQDPLFHYEGVGPEDVAGAELMTHLVSQQARKSKVPLALHTMWRDSFSYGLGIVSPQWDRRFGSRVVREDSGILLQDESTLIRQGSKKKVERNKLIWEGNRLENIDPYRYFPDPSVPPHEVQRGEFVGWMSETNRFNLLERDRDTQDFVFNAKYLKHLRSPTSKYGINKKEKDGSENPWRGDKQSNAVDVIWIYVDLIPIEWELGDGEYPETWLFGLAGDEVIIAAEKTNFVHGDFPVVSSAPDSDGYSSSPTSRMEVIQDLQWFVDFLYNSHIQNIRRAINNQFLVDPSLVNIFDVNDPKPGKIMRLRRRAWGRAKLDDAMKQFDVRDVTQGHIPNAQVMSQLMSEATGASDALRGQLPQRTSRISSAEIQGVRSSSLSRMEMAAQIISMQAHEPVATQFAANTQQFMEEETYIKATGEQAQRLVNDFGMDPQRLEQERVLVGPLDMAVLYDVMPYDGSVPGSEDVEAWVQMMQVISQSEELVQEFDMVRIVKHVARHMGAKNVDDFIRRAQPPQVVPDQRVDEQVRQGNLVGANGAV